jgi:hypothetical protein
MLVQWVGSFLHLEVSAQICGGLSQQFSAVIDLFFFFFFDFSYSILTTFLIFFPLQSSLDTEGWVVLVRQIQGSCFTSGEASGFKSNFLIIQYISGCRPF